jgi:hypothetical protein
MTTSRSERPEREAELLGYIEEVWQLAGAADTEATKPPDGREGEVQIKLLHESHTEVWRMTFCSCCDPPRHNGWRLAGSGAVS